MSDTPNRTTQLVRLAQARATKRITQAEYRQYTDYHTGLNILDGQTNSLTTQRLWACLKSPLGFIQCTDGQWRHIATVAKYGKRNPKGKSIVLVIVNRLIKNALDHLLTVQETATRPAYEVMIVGILTIRKKTNKAVIELLAADTMIEEEIKA